MDKGNRQADSRAESVVVDYGGAAAYAEELRKWLMASHCWSLCHQLASMHSYAYLAATSASPARPLPFGTVASPETITSARPVVNADRFHQRLAVPSFTRRIIAEVIDSFFAFAIKLMIVFVLVEMGIV